MAAHWVRVASGATDGASSVTVAMDVEFGWDDSTIVRNGSTVTVKVGIRLKHADSYWVYNSIGGYYPSLNSSSTRYAFKTSGGQYSSGSTWMYASASPTPSDGYKNTSETFPWTATITGLAADATSASITMYYTWKSWDLTDGTYSGNRIAKTLTITGIPAAATYTVSYDANGGTGAPGSQTKTAGVSLTLSSTSPSKANTTTTWSTNINANGGTGSVNSVSATATQYWGFTYWKSSYDNSTYNPGASYTTDASTTMVAQWYATGEATMTLPTADKFTKTGYVCIGFDTNPNATTPTYAPGAAYYTTANGDTLYAIYQEAPKNKIYTKVNGVYKQGDCYVKVNGVWKLADAVYVKVNGGWKEASQ